MAIMAFIGATPHADKKNKILKVFPGDPYFLLSRKPSVDG